LRVPVVAEVGSGANWLAAHGWFFCEGTCFSIFCVIYLPRVPCEQTRGCSRVQFFETFVSRSNRTDHAARFMICRIIEPISAHAVAASDDPIRSRERDAVGEMRGGCSIIFCGTTEKKSVIAHDDHGDHRNSTCARKKFCHCLPLRSEQHRHSARNSNLPNFGNLAEWPTQWRMRCGNKLQGSGGRDLQQIQPNRPDSCCITCPKKSGMQIKFTIPPFENDWQPSNEGCME